MQPYPPRYVHPQRGYPSNFAEQVISRNIDQCTRYNIPGTNGTTEVRETFSFDGLDRLKNSSLGATATASNLSLNDRGDILTKGGVGTYNLQVRLVPYVHSLTGISTHWRCADDVNAEFSRPALRLVDAIAAVRGAL